MARTFKAEMHTGYSRGRQFVTTTIRKREMRAARAAIRRHDYDAIPLTDTNTRRRINGIQEAR